MLYTCYIGAVNNLKYLLDNKVNVNSRYRGKKYILCMYVYMYVYIYLYTYILYIFLIYMHILYTYLRVLYKHS